MTPTLPRPRSSTVSVLSAILYLLSSILYPPSRAQQPTDTPSNIVMVPLDAARCLTLHPTKPVLFVGRDANAEAKNLVTFSLDDKGGIVEESRKEHLDGLYASPPVPGTSEYGLADIAIHPSRPEVYLAASPKNPRMFKADTNVAYVVGLALDDAGLPEDRIEDWDRPKRGSSISSLKFNRSGHFLYLSEHNGFLNVWPLEEALGGVKFEAAKKRLPAPERQKFLRAHADKRKSLVWPALRLIHWTYVPEWNRSYATDSSTKRSIFVLGDNGVNLSFAQYFGPQTRTPYPPLVSVKFRKMYVPNDQGAKLGIYQLTREGRLTSLPRHVSIDPMRMVRVDEANGLFYAVAKSSVSIYTLDADGYPVGQPRKFNLACGEIRDALWSAQSGILYLACTKPSPSKHGK